MPWVCGACNSTCSPVPTQPAFFGQAGSPNQLHLDSGTSPCPALTQHAFLAGGSSLSHQQVSFFSPPPRRAWMGAPPSQATWTRQAHRAMVSVGIRVLLDRYSQQYYRTKSSNQSFHIAFHETEKLLFYVKSTSSIVPARAYDLSPHGPIRLLETRMPPEPPNSHRLIPWLWDIRSCLVQIEGWWPGPRWIDVLFRIFNLEILKKCLWGILGILISWSLEMFQVWHLKIWISKILDGSLGWILQILES